MIVLVPVGTVAVGDVLDLDVDEIHHLRVRRAAPDAEVELRDGAGLVGAGRLGGADARHAQVQVTAVQREPAPVALELLVAGGDKDRFGWLVEKAAELGVTSIVPIETERTRGVASRVGPPRVAKLARRALDSIKQSGAAWAPAVETPSTFGAVIARAPGATRWLADASGEWPPATLARTPAVILIGPEGGFSAAEHAAAVAAGWRPIRLAVDVLRFETAALAAATAVVHARARESA